MFHPIPRGAVTVSVAGRARPPGRKPGSEEGSCLSCCATLQCSARVKKRHPGGSCGGLGSGRSAMPVQVSIGLAFAVMAGALAAVFLTVAFDAQTAPTDVVVARGYRIRRLWFLFLL